MSTSRERDKDKTKRLPLKLSLRTSLLYVIVAGLWIVLSDRILQPLAPFVEAYVHWQTIKGLLFVSVTGALLFLSMRTQLKRIQQAEADRAAVGTHFSNLLAESTDAIISIDHEQCITYFNKGAESIFAYKADEILGQSIDVLLPERFIDLHREHVTRFAESAENSVVMRTVTARHKNGKEFIAEATATKYRDNAGLVFTVIMRDISEREKAEKKIRRHLARANALAEIAARINANLDLSFMLEAICEEMAKALDVRATMVTLYDQKSDLILPAANFGLPETKDDLIRPVSADRYIKSVDEFGPVVIVPGLSEAADVFNVDLFRELEIHAIAIADMFDKEVFFGSLIAFSKDESRSFTENDILLMKGLAAQASTAIKNASLYSKAKIRLDNLHAMRLIDTAIASSLDLRHILQVLLTQAVSRLSVEAASVYLFNENTLMLEYYDSQGIDLATLSRTNIRLGEGIIGKVALEQRTLCVEDLAQEASWIRPIAISEGLKVYCGAPMIAKGQTRGVLEVFSKEKKFDDPEWIELLETLAGQASIAIETTSLFSELRQANYGLTLTYDTTLEGWSRALDLRDKETEGHTRRVTELSLKLAQKLGLKGEDLVHLRHGALLHDIGKLGVPDHILLKTGPLTEDEWEIMKQHPLQAYNLLYPIAYLRPALDIPYRHHERLDGSGYPDGLKGDEIPLAARIFAVVDVWDALISDRPYRKAWSHEKAFRYIRENASIQFDPSIVDAFLLLLEEEGYFPNGLPE